MREQRRRGLRFGWHVARVTRFGWASFRVNRHLFCEGRLVFLLAREREHGQPFEENPKRWVGIVAESRPSLLSEVL